MANKALWSVPSYTCVSALTCAELLTLANATLSCASAVIFNSSSTAHIYSAWELQTWIGTGTCAPYLTLYMQPALDLSNFVASDDKSMPMGVFALTTATSTAGNTMKRVSLVNVTVPPFDFKVALDNQTGQALSTALGASQLRAWLYDVNLNG